MGFFDMLEKMANKTEEFVKKADDWLDTLDTKKSYYEDDLIYYFLAEINGEEDSDIGKGKVTTNIHKIIHDYITEKHPDANSWGMEHNYRKLQKYSETVYRIDYKGLIVRICNTYGEIIGQLHYDVTVYTNKYAELVSGEEYKTTIKVW